MAIAIRIAMITTTTISSTGVKPTFCLRDGQRPQRQARVDHGGELAPEHGQVLEVTRSAPGWRASWT